MADSQYVSMGKESGGTSAKLLSSPSSSSSSTQLKDWLSAHRTAVLIATVVVVAVIAALVGLGLYLSSGVDDSASSVSSSTGGGIWPSPSSTPAPPAMSSSGASSVHPACSGLYEWACADWFQRTPLPVNRTSYSRFSEIDVINQGVLDVLLQSGHTGYPLLDNLYASCMDVERINQLGLKPLQPFLRQLEQVAGWGDFMHLLGEWRSLFGMTLIVAPALSNSQSRVSLTLNQAPLLLPNRASYGNASAVSVLQGTIQRMFTAAGDRPEDAARYAGQVIDLETALNGIMPNSTQPMQLSSLGQLLQYSNVGFDRWLEGAQVPLAQVPASLFSVSFPAAAFFQRLNATWMATDKPSSEWLQYARYKLLNAAAPYLAQNIFSAFTYAHFPVREVDPNVVAHASVKVAVEVQELVVDEARHLVCKRLINMADIGSDLLGNAFMDSKFNSTAYALVESMIADVRKAWTQWLPSIDWLDAPGRVAFQQKMDNMKAYIGGPPLLASYANVTNSQPDDYFNNVLTLRRLHAIDSWATLLKPFDPIRLWNGSPASTVNAYYYSQYNSFYLYAGFFQAPLFFVSDYVANAPWTGEVIGHEAGHGFDANGINFNQTGVRTQWLSPAVVSAFNARTACTMNSYSRLQWNGSYVNGNKTIGENMADIIGIRVAYLSYKAWAAQQPVAPLIPGDFLPKVDTLDQYFMAHWAQTECTQQTPAALRNQILNDVHAPGFARINGAAQLFKPMSEAFDCPVGSYMNPVPDQSCFIY